jgi:DNA-binding protein Fis
MLSANYILNDQLPAKDLKIHRNTLGKKIAEYKI